MSVYYAPGTLLSASQINSFSPYDLPGGSVGKESACNAGDSDSVTVSSAWHGDGLCQSDFKKFTDQFPRDHTTKWNAVIKNNIHEHYGKPTVFPRTQTGKLRTTVSEGASQVVPVVKNPPANARDIRDPSSIPGSGRFPWRKKWQPTPVFLPRESHGQRSLVGYSPWGCKESDTTEAT